MAPFGRDRAPSNTQIAPLIRLIAPFSSQIAPSAGERLLDPTPGRARAEDTVGLSPGRARGRPKQCLGIASCSPNYAWKGAREPITALGAVAPRSDFGGKRRGSFGPSVAWICDALALILRTALSLLRLKGLYE